MQFLKNRLFSRNRRFLRNGRFLRNRLLWKLTTADSSLYSNRVSNRVLESLRVRRDCAHRLLKPSWRPFSMYHMRVCAGFLFAKGLFPKHVFLEFVEVQYSSTYCKQKSMKINVKNEFFIHTIICHYLEMSILTKCLPVMSIMRGL
jgi:hypothetical protein